MGRIGVASGSPRLLNRVAVCLEDRGHVVTGSATFDPALQLAEQSDLLVVDVALPDPGGLELVAQLRRTFRPDTLPILFLTDDDEDAFLRGFGAGASDCLTRDVSESVLAAKCVRLLRAPREAQPGVFVLPQPGELILERFQLERLLGRGTYGAVFAAEDLQRNEHVALKLLLTGSATDSETRERFLREAYALAALRDPHVVAVHDFGQQGELLYCAMELVSGASLEARIRTRGACAHAEVLSLLRGLCSALVQLERADLVHRDIKPANVMLRGGDPARPVLVDFGLAKMQLDHGVTAPGVILGSPGYIAPELLSGAADHKSDLFSLGQVASFAARGGEAFPGLAGIQLMTRMARQAVPLPRDLSPGLAQILRKLTALRPESRHPSATALYQELLALDEDTPTERTRL